MQIKKYCIKTLIIFLDHILDVSMNDFIFIINYQKNEINVTMKMIIIFRFKKHVYKAIE